MMMDEMLGQFLVVRECYCSEKDLLISCTCDITLR